MTDAANRIVRTLVQVLVALAGAVPIITYLHIPAAASAAIAAGLTVAVTVLHNVMDALGVIQKVAPSSAQPYVVDAEDVVAHLEDIAGELSQHLVTQAPAAGVSSTINRADFTHGSTKPVPDVAGKDITPPARPA